MCSSRVNMTDQQEQKILREARDRLKRAMEDDDENRRAALDDLRFAFTPGVRSIPAIGEPAESVTWSLDAVSVDDDVTIDELEAIVRGD